jgi:hypothetical protein
MDPIGWVLGLGFVALLYLTVPIVAIVLVVLLIAVRPSRRFGVFVAAASLVIAVVLAPWVDWGFGSEAATTSNMVWAVVLYIGQIAIACLLSGIVIRLLIWVWRRLAPLFATTGNQ